MKLLTLLSIFLSILSSNKSHAVAMISKARKWDKKEFVVCFAQTKKDVSKRKILVNEQARDQMLAFPEELKDLAKEAVDLSFSTTSLRFLGWGDCAATKQPDIVLLLTSDSMPAMATPTIGDPRKAPFSKRKTVASIFINLGFLTKSKSIYEESDLAISPLLTPYQQLQVFGDPKPRAIATINAIKTGIVHEFTHVMGLQHEYLRSENDETLMKIDLSTNHESVSEIIQFREDEKQQKSYLKMPPEALGEYDLMSVTNYYRNNLNQLGYSFGQICRFQKLPFCNQALIEKIDGRPDATRGYLSAGDIEALNYIYDDIEPTGSWVPESNAIIDELVKINNGTISAQ